eukprot:TRINITY_DN4876_c0_g1_i2.p1 TRINITY_DN4876_c0_g1~~TRINITY_DN4876_c0_g1_i2.p1  ORF type:complete len:501 (-),score=39.69 TRINITY_DN4876_c0_g1_i2:41-1543(-)
MSMCLPRFVSQPAQGCLDSNEEQILETLRHGQSALRKLRWCIGTFWIISLLATICLFCLLDTQFVGKLLDYMILQPCLEDLVDPEYPWYWAVITSLLCSSFCTTVFVFPILAPLDDDVGFKRCILVLTASFLAYRSTHSLLVSVFNLRWDNVIYGITDIACSIAGYAYVVYAMWGVVRWHTPQLMQRGLQRPAILFLSIISAARVWQLVTLGVTGNFIFILRAAGRVVENVLAAYMLLRTQALESVQAKMRQWMETRGATRAAAAIACLIGSADPKVVLEQAQQTFRSIDISQLTFDDLRDHVPDPRLNVLAESAKLGHCDAFVSHSWHDDASAKWKALQQWRCCFRAKYGREPRVWFDKVCIDQTNIEADLRCLPIFLSGCNSLLVLYGPTYLSRLWCIIEIFTFILVGGSIENIDIKCVLREEPAHDDMRLLVSAFEDFDVADCQCYDQSDKARILAIVGTAFGSLGAFNEVVVNLLAQIQRVSPTLSQMSQASLDTA